MIDLKFHNQSEREQAYSLLRLVENDRKREMRARYRGAV